MLIHSLPEVVGNSIEKFWLNVKRPKSVLFHKDTVLSKGVLERRTPIRSGLFAFMSKFIERKYSRATNVVASRSHDGTLKWKRPNSRFAFMSTFNSHGLDEKVKTSLVK